MINTHVLLKVHATDEYGYRVNGAVIKVDDKLREMIEDLRRRQRRAKADLEVHDSTPTWVDDTGGEFPYARLAAGVCDRRAGLRRAVPCVFGAPVCGASLA